jgi:DNA repair exonuclease SbcCD ATPase subunit
MASQERFRFEPGDEEPELALPDEELKQRVKRLSQRISFLTLLLPCLIAIVIYVAYRDLVLRVNTRQNAELLSVERLVQDAEQKIGSLNHRLSDMEAALAKLGDFEKSLQARQEELRKSEATLEKISVAKADRKDLEENVQRLEEGLAAVNKNVQGLSRELQALAPFREEIGASASLRSEIQGLSARLQKLETNLGKDLTGLAGYMERTKSELEKIKSDLNGLQARKLDRDALDLETLKTKRLYQMALDQEISRLDKSLNALQRRLEQVERSFGSKSSTPSLPPLTGGISEQSVE